MQDFGSVLLTDNALLSTERFYITELGIFGLWKEEAGGRYRLLGFYLILFVVGLVSRTGNHQ